MKSGDRFTRRRLCFRRKDVYCIHTSVFVTFWIRPKNNPINSVFWLAMTIGPVPSKDMQIPPLSEVTIITLKMRTVLNRVKNNISDFSNFYFLSNDWLYLQFTMTQQVCHRQKKVVQKWPSYRKDAHCSDNYFSWVYFGRILVFDVWSILYMVIFGHPHFCFVYGVGILFEHFLWVI